MYDNLPYQLWACLTDIFIDFSKLAYFQFSENIFMFFIYLFIYALVKKAKIAMIT
jgi:hypothetical protein